MTPFPFKPILIASLVILGAIAILVFETRTFDYSPPGTTERVARDAGAIVSPTRLDPDAALKSKQPPPRPVAPAHAADRG